MFSIKKILIRCIAAAALTSFNAIDVTYFNTVSIAYAEPVPVHAEADYMMGDNETRINAKKSALELALEAALRKVAISIQSDSRVVNYQLEEQKIITYAKGRLQIIREDYEFLENGTVCRAKVDVSVEVDYDALINPTPTPAPTPDPTPNPTPNPNPYPYPTPNPEPYPYPVPEPTPVQPPTPSVDYIVWEETGHVYRIVDGLNLNYRQAEQWCKDHGGHLIYIETHQEQSFIFSVLFTKGTKNCYWIGGQRGVNKKWYWGDQRNTPMRYTHWAEGQPDNFTKQENMLMMYRLPNPKAESTTGQWNDIGGDGECKGEAFFGVSNFGFICEWESQAQVRD
ncbi:MAG: C-type lectin domain-containing protein [Selenomonadaceae bacterium]|nr:C-type lectin domain-containing protein [Selenomonadaceae bacterium]MBR1858267.1 C-type lectin domain-containing protein [Selenomonadaceae bacterium]